MNKTNSINSVPPINIEAEEAILGGILLDPDAYARIDGKLQTAMFSMNSHRIIFRAMTDLYKAKKPTDLMGVGTFLADRELLETVGGTTKLGQLLNRTVSAVNIDRYAELLIDKWKRRKLIELGEQFTNWGYDTSIELDELITQVFTKVEEWIGDREVNKPKKIIGKMKYVVTARETHQNYEEAFHLETELDMNSDTKVQLKHMREEIERLLKE